MTAPTIIITPWQRIRNRSGRPWSLEAQLTGSALGAIILFSLVSLIYLSQTSNAASASDHIMEQYKEKQKLEMARAEFQRQIADLTAPDALETRAIALGYGPAQETLFVDLNAAQPVSLEKQTTVQFPSSPSPNLSPIASRWTELQQRLTTWLDKNSPANVP